MLAVKGKEKKDHRGDLSALPKEEKRGHRHLFPHVLALDEIGGESSVYLATQKPKYYNSNKINFVLTVIF